MRDFMGHRNVYYLTCLKRNLGIMETYLCRKNFAVRIIQPADPYVKYLY